MPLLRQRLPGVHFYAVGSKPPAEIQALASEDVIITGFVEDLNPLLDKMRVSVAPLRYGAGIKGKIGSAMAVGLPVVATPLAAEGMSLTDGENILVAEGAEAICRCYCQNSIKMKLSGNKSAITAWSLQKMLGGLKRLGRFCMKFLTDISITTIRGPYPLSLFSESAITQTEIKKSPNELTPIASVKNREDFTLALDSDLLRQIR